MRPQSLPLRGVLLAALALLMGLAIALTAILQTTASAAPKPLPPRAKPQPAETPAKAHRGPGIPQFELDASWPRGLPNMWAFGGGAWVSIDSQDHAWVLHRPLAISAADVAAGNIAAPPVIELDLDGDYLRAWGGPAWIMPWFVGSFGTGEDYPAGTPPEHAIQVDDHGNVWVIGNGNMILKFAPNGALLLRIGEFEQTGGSNDPELLGNPTDVAVDEKANEVFVSDGYVNRRVIVFDATTGAYKRHWGAYGNVPSDDPPDLFEPGAPPPEQFFVVHCIELSNDGLLYVCDRGRNRIQVFKRDGTFVKEVIHTPEAPAGAGITVTGPFGRPDVAAAGFGSGNVVAFSADRKQRFLYVAAGAEIKILERRSLKVVGSFPGSAHGMATDSKGNIYTSNRQKFRLVGFSASDRSTAPRR